MVSYRAVLRTASAGIAGVFNLTFFIQETVIMGLLEGVIVALRIVPTGLDAVLEVSNFEGINEVAFTLDCLMTLASRTPGKEIERFTAKKKANDRLDNLTYKVLHL